uniref:ATP-dependent Clp protease proteolytic subunit n=1 Tax=Haptolina ericina TaxID=156174 RepID=A0A7S3AU29_9EUKA|mmetsp:Transcript_34646/g.78537  ORF Transcript_34646/g.78537 Transcript_34646/m.78537 type:complete len:229 (+) Transcript_34646:22-708(+)
MTAVAALLASLPAFLVGGAGRVPSMRAGSPTMMPIGVPKVAYKAPGAYGADWIDLYNRMYRERILFLGKQIDDEQANQMIGIMLYLDSEDNSKQISMYINSPGGSVTAGFAMFDTIRHIKSDVSTINVGMAASMGSFLLCAGTPGKRLALPHSRTMIHQPASGGMQGQASDIKVMAEQILYVRERCVNYYAQLSGQPREKVVRDLDRDNWLTAQEALEYGLIDKVISR